MSPGRVVFLDPETGDVIDGFELEAIPAGEVIDARDLVARVFGIAGDPVALLARIEIDTTFRRALLAHEYEPVFQGAHGGRMDAIATAVFVRAQSMCRSVEARIECEEALRKPVHL